MYRHTRLYISGEGLQLSLYHTGGSGIGPVSAWVWDQYSKQLLCARAEYGQWLCGDEFTSGSVYELKTGQECRCEEGAFPDEAISS